MSNKLAYYFNALYYLAWDCWRINLIKGSKVFDCLFGPLFRLFINPNRSQRDIVRYYKDSFNNENGSYFPLFKNRFLSAYGALNFPVILTMMALTMPYVLSPWGGVWVIIATAIASVVLCYFPVYKYVIIHDRYLPYFRIFERKDKAWHKKWRIIGYLFWLLVPLMVAVGVILMICISNPLLDNII